MTQRSKQWVAHGVAQKGAHVFPNIFAFQPREMKFDEQNLYGCAPRGPMGVKKSHFFSQMKLFSFCAKIGPKRHKLQKIIKIEEKMSKNPCFLGLFWIFFNLVAILAHQTSTGMFSGSWGIFWHPWDPWERINSGDTRVLRFVLIILWWWRRCSYHKAASLV